MKMKIATALFTIATVMGYTDEHIIVQTSKPSTNFTGDLRAVQNSLLKKSFGYFRMGIADPDAINSVQTLPGLGFGYRYGMYQSAVDISANYTSHATKDTYKSFSYTAPKISYLRYLSSDIAPQSFYLGAGLGWSAVIKGSPDDFQGVSATISAGYETNRNQNVHGFFQIDVSQAAVEITTTTALLQKSWKPLAEVSLGLGF
jgi:hypothetical protein